MIKDEKQKLEEELNKRLTPMGLTKYAWDYYTVFEDTLKKYPKDIEMTEVKYYLLCHSIELAMKALLRQKGYSRKQLMELGHDLEALVKELHKIEVYIDVNSMLNTFTANQYYKTKQFEYPQTGYKELPNIDAMNKHARLLLSLVRNAIYKEFPRK